jgi:transcriptional regulator of acetoin/glycerol metabolism
VGARAPDRAALEHALDCAGWNVSRTAKALGVARVTLYRWLDKHGVSRAPSRSS